MAQWCTDGARYSYVALPRVQEGPQGQERGPGAGRVVRARNKQGGSGAYEEATERTKAVTLNRSRYCGCGTALLPYLSAHADAERRLRHGERQLWCGPCDGWVWPDHCEHPGRLTSKEHAAMLRSAKKYAATFDTDEKRYQREVKKLIRGEL